MAVATDTVDTTDAAAATVTSIGVTFAPTASATAVLASIVLGDAPGVTLPTGLGVTWAAQTCTIPTGADTGFLTSANHKNRAVLFGVGSPTTGSHSLTASWTNNYSGYIGGMSWKGSDTTTPFKNGTTATATSTSPSVSVTSPANDFAVGVVFLDTQTPVPNQTQWWVDTAEANNGAANYTTGAGSTTLSMAAITSDLWGYAACDVQVPAGAADTLMAQACL